MRDLMSNTMHLCHRLLPFTLFPFLLFWPACIALLSSTAFTIVCLIIVARNRHRCVTCYVRVTLVLRPCYVCVTCVLRLCCVGVTCVLRLCDVCVPCVLRLCYVRVLQLCYLCGVCGIPGFWNHKHEEYRSCATTGCSRSHSPLQRATPH